MAEIEPVLAGCVDLEARLRDAAKALHAGNGQEFLSPRFTFNVDGQRGGRDAAVAWLGEAHAADVTVRVVSVKRNLLFVDWAWPTLGAGVAVLSWDQDGLLSDILVQRRVKD